MEGIRTRITESLIDLFKLDKGDKIKNYGYFEGILSIAVNFVLFLIKFIFGTINIAVVFGNMGRLLDFLVDHLLCSWIDKIKKQHIILSDK